MQLDKVVSWYQKKISTYDKQQWEKTVEQRILAGFVHVPLKNTELKKELIDVDLVRGSSFPKAKPKQGLTTVLKLSLLRYVLLPLYARWWVRQTSPKIFTGLLVLYAMQMFNLGIYSYNVHRIGENENESYIVVLSDFIIPMALGLVLSMIHSQIVATAAINAEATGKRNPLSMRSRRGNRERVRRKRKSDMQTLRRSSDIKMTLSAEHQSNLNLGTVYIRKPPLQSCSSVSSTTTKTNSTDETTTSPPPQPPLCRSSISAPVSKNVATKTGLRKRNVNFNSANLESTTTLARQRMPMAQLRQPEREMAPDVIGEAVERQQMMGEDDGFESLNGKSSSGEENTGGAQKRSDLNAEDETPNNQASTISKSMPDVGVPIDLSFGDVIQPKSQLHNTNGRPPLGDSSDTTDEEGNDDDDDEAEGGNLPSSAGSNGTCGGAGFTEGTTSATEWIGITTNSEDGSYNSSELEASDSQLDGSENGGDYDFTPTVILNPCCGTSDRISCTIWERRQTKKAEMSVLDISSAIIERVEAMPDTCEYLYIGVALSVTLSIVPAFCRLCEATATLANSTDINIIDIPSILLENSAFSSTAIFRFAFGETLWERTVLVVSFVLRISLTFLFFFMLAVSERTFKQRFLYAKLFSHLTSSRRARKSKVPHFRLNKVRNIKIWLSVRSYLKRRGPQRSVDVIVSAAFILTLLFLAFLSVEWLKDSVHLQSQYNLEALIWSCCLGCFLLRFMTLGTKINRKYRSLSVLITEQINLYLQIEQKPQKKEELMVANSVLKLAADLLKELESPFKISGLSANPYLYTTIKVVILSALSGVLSEMLGFKLKLHKIKIK